MSEHIFKCKACASYTMEKTCPACGAETINPKPPKYSPEDKMGSYRRKAKGME